MELELYIKRYNSLCQHLLQIQRSGKILRLTRSQIQAIKNRLSRCLSVIRKQLRLAPVTIGLFSLYHIDLDAQCKMNRSPITTQSSFLTLNTFIAPIPADIDDDGDYDLIVGNHRGTLNTYINRNGVFKRSYGLLNPFDLLNVGFESKPAFIDIDNDGDVDAFIGESEGMIKFFRNNEGTFTEVDNIDYSFNQFNFGQLAAPAFTDVDNDGDTDVFVGAIDGTIHFFRNINGTFTKEIGDNNPLDGVDVGSLSTIGFADINSDNFPDAFIGENDGTIIYYSNDNGVFTPVTGTNNPFNNVDLGFYTHPSFADIDGDGDVDAFIGANDGTLSFESIGIIHFFRNDNGVFNKVSGHNSPFLNIDVGQESAPTFGDIDKDGDDDVVVGAGDGTIRTYINTNGVFNELTGPGNPFDGIDVGCCAKPALVDIDPTDSDSDLDLVVGNGDGKVQYYRNNNGVFVPISEFLNPLATVDVGSSAAPTFVDFDGDNDKDAFVGALDGTIHYFRNEPGLFGARVFVKVEGAGNPFDGIDVGSLATPAFFLFDVSRAFVGNSQGIIKEFRKMGNNMKRFRIHPLEV